MSIERWDDDTHVLLALDDLKRRFEDEHPRGRVLRFEVRFSQAFGEWMVRHPVWLEVTRNCRMPPMRSPAGWIVCDCIHLVPGTVCQGLARLVAVLEGGRVVQCATLVGGPA